MKLNKYDLSQVFPDSEIPDNLNIETERISTDTRTLDKNNFFFAIKGKNFDGNKFAPNALKCGVKIVFCSSKTPVIKPSKDTVILKFTKDLDALYELSQLVLSKTHALKFAVTGSNGKTSTKEILSTLLSSNWKPLKTFGNFNNQIGVPLTLFKLKPEHSAIVLELGMNQLGEIHLLSDLFKPKYGIITNVQRAHLEFLRTLDNIAKAKCELIPNTSEAVAVCADSEILIKHAEKHKTKLIRFSLEKNTDIFMERLISLDIDSSRFLLKDNLHNETVEVELPLPGRHNISNYLSAYTVTRLAGLKPEEILSSTKNIKPFSGRYSIHRIKDITFIDDSYNANPDSMKEGLYNFSLIKNVRKTAILGDMMELGKDTEAYHTEIGNYITGLEIDSLLTFGDMATHIGKGAKAKGMRNIKSFLDYNELIQYIKKTLKKGEHVFIKASNSLGLSNVCRDIETEE